VSPRLILDRNFAIGTLLVFAYGMLAFVPLVLLPTLLKDLKGYPDSLIGLVLAMRGVGMLVGFFVAARISQRTARPAMVVGLLLVGASGLLIGLADLNVSAYHVETVTFLQGLGTGILWVPITLVAFQTLPPSLLPEGSALFHLGRQIGTSLFVSLSVMVVLRTSTISYAELAASISSHREVLKLPFAIGAFDVESAHGLARLSAEMSRQARMIGYVNAFMLYSAISVACLGLLALIRKPAPPRA
jgi:DHA2 family multidrug resistance protein